MSETGFCEAECEECEYITSHKIIVETKKLRCLVCGTEQNFECLSENEKVFTRISTTLNKEGFKKLQEKNKCAEVGEQFAKEMIRECLITNATEGTITLELNHKELGSWKFIGKIIKGE